MNARLVHLVAFQEQDNLGVGYLASVLLREGYRVKMVDFRLGSRTILDNILHDEPLLVGFSIIFQYHINAFRDLLESLRVAGVDCHFTAGGHYPSLRYRELLGRMPQLDSVVLFEGEHTLLNLVRALEEGGDWRTLSGIAHCPNGSIQVNPLQPLETDLDRFPPPVRPPLREYALGKKYATLLAGRGCVYDCSFCSIRQFYGTPPGPVKRLRRPEMVVREMELLAQEMGCSIFMFQDDDFPVSGRRGVSWAETFCDLLEDKGLHDRIMWKINCRPDEVEPGLFRRMRQCGLFLVYLGIESGTDEGLRFMNKHLDIAANHRGVESLKELKVSFDYGFMLFDPTSTFDSVRNNLDFLRSICGDGSSPITFCKMLPYAETRVESDLRQAGRLRGKADHEDYDFLEPALDDMYAFITSCFWTWIADRDGLLNSARWAKYFLAVSDRFLPQDEKIEALRSSIQSDTAESNRYFLDCLGTLCSLFEYDGLQARESSLLESIRSETTRFEAAQRDRFRNAINEIEGCRQLEQR